MSKQTEALKLALEALEESLGYVEEEAENAQRLYGQYPTRQARIQGLKDDARKHMNAITAIREALAEQPAQQRPQNCGTGFCSCIECPYEQPAQQQEPVVWMYQNKSTHEVSFQKHMRSFVDHGAWYEVPLYSEPLANQEKTSGSPKPAKPEALRLADAMEYDLDWCDEAAAELRRMHDLLGKANALCRIRAEEIERLKAQPEQEPVAVKQIAEALRKHGLTLVKTAHSYHVMDLGRIEAQTASPPARKPWVGLDQQDIDIAFDDTQEGGGFDDFARAIEAKLREKNAPQQSKEDA